MAEAFDPARWAQHVFIRPTRDQFEEGWRKTAPFLQMKRKLQVWCEKNKFEPIGRYHATVVLRGVRAGQQGASMMSAVRVLSDAPIGFAEAISHMFHVELGHGGPMIGMVASEEPLDSLSALAHFVTRGDEG